jgi:hypothetical protein
VIIFQSRRVLVYEAQLLSHFFHQSRKTVKIALQCESYAGIAQLVERNLAKVEVASSRLVSRSKSSKGSPGFPFLSGFGAVAKRLCTGLQIRVGRFDSGPRLHIYASSTLSMVRFFSFAQFDFCGSG